MIKDTKAAHFERGHVRDIIAGWGPRPALPFALWESKDARRFEKAQRGDDADEVEETGAEREKRLRRLAQRGVVRLFNAIAAAQGVPEKVAKEEAKKTRREDGASEMGGSEAGGGEEGAPPNKILRRPNVLGGRGKGEACEYFFLSFVSSHRPVYHLLTDVPTRFSFLNSVQFVKGVVPRSHQSRNIVRRPSVDHHSLKPLLIFHM